uniref:Uncharacterized protein n=1 Tax=Rhizophora mucronata TaxID=61149 RepID=A0A2P2QT23_RHIMU
MPTNLLWVAYMCISYVFSKTTFISSSSLLLILSFPQRKKAMK